MDSERDRAKQERIAQLRDSVGHRGVYDKGRQRREDVLRCALELVSEQGFTKFSIREVARRCDMPLANVQYYFPTKSALIAGMVLWRIEQDERGLRSQIDGFEQEDPEDAVRTIVRFFCEEYFKETSHVYAVMHDLAYTDNVIAAAKHDVYVSYIGFVADALRETRPGLSLARARRSARLITAVIDGVVLQPKRLPGTQELIDDATELSVAAMQIAADTRSRKQVALQKNRKSAKPSTSRLRQIGNRIGRHGTSDRGQQHREEILRVAAEALAEKGFLGFSLRDTAARAGVSLGKIQYYFSSKSKLLAAVVLWRIHAGEEEIRKVVTPSDDASATVQQVVSHCLLSYSRESVQAYMAMHDHAHHDKEIGQAKTEVYRSFVGFVVDLLLETDPDADKNQVRRVSRLITAIVDGVLVQPQSIRGSKQLTSDAIKLARSSTQELRK